MHSIFGLLGPFGATNTLSINILEPGIGGFGALERYPAVDDLFV